jgi:predicted nucleic acid-binding Zn ribbon protein
MAHTVKCPRCGRSTLDATYCQYCGKALHSCPACGARISSHALFCPECGAPISKEQREAISVERTSWTWWLLPLLLAIVYLGWLGGLIAWSLLRYRDPNKATNLLWFGISLTVIEIIVTIVLRFSNISISNTLAL